MQASIDVRHLKDFVRLLQCASKYGDDLCIHANKDIWELAVTNSSSSAFCLFKLYPEFFSRYSALGNPSARRKGVKCSLLVKSVLAVLGKANSISTIERLDLLIRDPKGELKSKPGSSSASSASVSGSHTDSDLNGPARSDSDFTGFDDDDYDADPHSPQSVLIVRLVCKHGVTKMHTLNLTQSEFIRVDIDPDSTPSSFTISARTLRNWLDHFSLTSSHISSTNNQLKAENQLGWMFGKNEVRLKSWEGGSKDLCTEIKVDVAEFGHDSDGVASYWVEQERVDLTLPMKEFRATLQLADSMNIDLTIAFSLPSQPLTMVYTGGLEDSFDIFCAIATMNCEAFPTDFGKGGGAGANDVAGGGGGGDTRPIGGLDPKGRRIVSDLTDDGVPHHGNGDGQGGGDKDMGGPDQAEGSQRNGNSSANGHANKRHKSDYNPSATPRRSQSAQSQTRRQIGRLDITPSARRTGSIQPAMVYGTPIQRSGSVNGNGGGGGSSQVGGIGHEGNGRNGGDEALFMPGGSQEDDDAAQPRATQGVMQMSQEEVLQLSGLADIGAEGLMDLMDEGEDEDYEAEQAARARGLGPDGERRGGEGRRGQVGALESWDDGDLEDGQEGGMFEADGSIFDPGVTYDPPPESSFVPLLPSQSQSQYRSTLPPGRVILGERSMASIGAAGRREEGRDGSGRTGPAQGPGLGSGGVIGVGGLGMGTGTGSSGSSSRGREYPPARVRSETEEDREMRGDIRGMYGGGDRDRGGSKRMDRDGQGGVGNGKEGEDEDDDFEELGPTQEPPSAGRKFTTFFKD